MAERTTDARVLAACRASLATMRPDMNYVTAAQLDEMLRVRPESVFLLDNRTPDAYAAGHIEGAVNVWIQDVLGDESLALLPHDRVIVVCCWVGHTASQVVAVLRVLGYEAVGLKYGMGTPRDPTERIAGWDTCGLPVTASIERSV